MKLETHLTRPDSNLSRPHSTDSTSRFATPGATSTVVAQGRLDFRSSEQNLTASIRVEQLSALSAPAWDAFVDRHPEGTFFHGLAWKDAVARTFGHRPHYLMACKGEAIVGLLPLFEVKSIFAGTLLISVPYATYGGILSDSAEIANVLFEKAKALAVEIGARSLEIRSIHASVSDLDTVRTHAAFQRPLPKDLDGFGDYLPRKARAAARKAVEQGGLEVLFDNEHLSTVWNLYARSMRRLGSPNYPIRFFKELVAATPEKHVVQLIRFRDRPVAGLLTFLHGDRVMPYFAGLDERVKLYGLNQFLYQESMRWGVEHGYSLYDFGRTRYDNPGPFNFKRFCGFEPQPLEYQVYQPLGEKGVDLSPTSRRWKYARAVWKKLPLVVTRPLGAWLARSIPG